MPVKLPDLSATRCVAFLACGTLDTEKHEALEQTEKQAENVLVASYGHGKTAHLVRLVMGGSNPRHVHVDVLRKAMVKDDFLKATHKRKEIETILNALQNEKIDTKVAGLFIIPLDELPEGSLIRSTFFDKKQGDLSIKATGAKLTIKGAPIQGIEWEFDEDAVMAKIDMRARVETVIDSDYLTRQLGLLESGFKLFVLGES
jgi:hypothetical protein